VVINNSWTHAASFFILSVFRIEKTLIMDTQIEIPVLKKSKITEVKTQTPAASSCCTPKNNESVCCTPSEKAEDNGGACCAQPSDGSACCNK
jgi:hypothetical protein